MVLKQKKTKITNDSPINIENKDSRLKIKDLNKVKIMTSYKVVLFSEYSASGQEETKNFTGENAKEELEQFLDQNGYDYNEAEVVKIIEGGGEYKGLENPDAIEFTIQLTITDDIPAGPTKEEIEAELEAERLEKEKDEKEEKEEAERLEAERIENERLEKEREEQEKQEEEQRELAEKLEQERLDEIEKNKSEFNNAELFVKAFKDALIGRKINFDDGESTVIISVKDSEGTVYIENTGFNDILIDTETDKDDFKNFIEGKKIGDFILAEKEELKIEVQEEVVPVTVNKSEYRYYIIADNKILAGFEYLEDANIDLEKRKQFGETGISVISKKALSVTPDDNNNWNTEIHDWEIISACIMSGVKSKDYSEKDAKKFIDGFKQSGAYKDQVKAKLILCLEKEHKNLRSAFMMSNPERVAEKCDETLRIQNELKRIISI